MPSKEEIEAAIEAIKELRRKMYDAVGSRPTASNLLDRNMRNDIAEAFAKAALTTAEKVRNERLESDNKILLNALEYVDEACLCERFPTRKMKKGFDYHETHPRMGKCESGSRWLTPRDKAKAAIEAAKE